jgi:hypothetical protein
MKIDIATWDAPEDVQNLIDDYNKSHNLDIKIVTFENRDGTYFATIEYDKLTKEDAFYLGKNYGRMVEDFRARGML